MDKSGENAQMICWPAPSVQNNRDEGMHNPFDCARDGFWKYASGVSGGGSGVNVKVNFYRKRECLG